MEMEMINKVFTYTSATSLLSTSDFQKKKHSAT